MGANSEQFHNTGEWRAVKDVSVELSQPMLLSPSLLSSGLPFGSGYRRLLLYLWLSHAISAAKEAMRRLVMGPMEKQQNLQKLEDTSTSSSPIRIKTSPAYSLAMSPSPARRYLASDYESSSPLRP